MAIQHRVVPDKAAARRLIETLLDRSGVKHRELADALFLSRGALARKLGVRYPDRFTEHELQSLAAFLGLTVDQRGHLLSIYGYAGAAPPAIRRASIAPIRDAEPQSENPQTTIVLPSALTSFVGREWERATTKRLLATTRLLTLTGAGGIGKTRLALEAARETAPLHRDGVHWVDLSALRDGAGVLPAIATALGLRDAPDRTLFEVVRDRLRPHETLLVLDNCEHVLDTTAAVIESLLGSCPTLVILATSRAPIGAAGEMLWRVPALSIPPDPATEPEAIVTESESVRLFSDRAAAAHPGFAVTDRNAHAVARICRRLDGIPLAIELAAAGVETRTLDEIAANLDHALRLHAGSRRTATRRHTTLQAAIDWSHALLAPAERTLLRRLAVFAGGFDLQAARAVVDQCGTEGEAPDSQSTDVPEVCLDRLVQASLVQAEDRREPTRFRLLEPIRQFGLERLEHAGEAETLRQRHQAHYIDVLERGHAALRGPDQARSLEQLDADYENLRVALAWSLAHGNVSEAVQMVGRLALYWEMHGRFTEGLAWAERTVTAARNISPVLHARALHSTGHLRRLAGDLTGSIAYSEQSLALFLELGDESRAAAVLINIAGAHWNQGDFPAARQGYEQALGVFRRLDDRLQIAQTLANLGMVANAEADLDRARVYLHESLECFRGLNDRWSGARVLLALAAAADMAGDFAAAQAVAEECLALYRALEDERGEAWVLVRLASIAAHQRDQRSAHDLYEQSLFLSRRVADKRNIVQALHGLAGTKLRRHDVEAARSLERESLILGCSIGASWAIPDSLEGLARVAAVEARLPAAARLLGAAAALRDELVYPHPPADRPGHEIAVAALRAEFGEKAFAAAWAEGRALSREQAIVEALKDPDGRYDG